MIHHGWAAAHGRRRGHGDHAAGHDVSIVIADAGLGAAAVDYGSRLALVVERPSGS
jgi:hypothetical protein